MKKLVTSDEWQVLSQCLARVTRHLPLATLFLITACGFQPLHSRSYRDSQAVDLSAISVTVDHTRGGQLLEAEIKDAINPDYEHQEKLYALNIVVTSSETKLFITPSGTSTRTDIPLTSTYKLTRKSDGKLLDSGTITRLSSYNTTSADYSSYVSMQDARKRAVLELAQDYKLRLANILAKLQQRPTP